MNGLALHGGFIPYGGTFLTFSDYARNALRMAALMKLRVDLRLHARLDRPGRGRPDAPVDRARRQPAPDPEPGRLAALRHGRDRGRLDRARSSARDGPTAPAVLAPEPAVHAARRGDRSRRSRAAATCSPTATRRAEARVHHRHRLRSRTGAGRAEALAAEGIARARRLDALHQRLRPPGRRLSRRACCRTGVPRVAVEAGVTDCWRKYVGAATTAARGRHRPLRRIGAGAGCCSSTSASRSRTSSADGS